MRMRKLALISGFVFTWAILIGGFTAVYIYALQHPTPQAEIAANGGLSPYIAVFAVVGMVLSIPVIGYALWAFDEFDKLR